MSTPYEPPASRPAVGGIVREPKSRLWFGFGLGWAAIAFTLLWVVVVSWFLSSFTFAAREFVRLALLFVPTLALLGYFALRREWRSVLGVLLAWASAIALVLLLVAACLGIMGLGRSAG